MTETAMTGQTYSVLMSVYQKEKPEYLRQSIQSMMDQTLPFSDFVLVCDGPLNEGLENVIAWASGLLGEKLQCVRLAENRGLGRALAAGMPYCRCPVIVRMDSDDLSRPGRCELQMKKMQSGAYAIVGGTLREFRKVPGDLDRYRRTPETPEEIRRFVKRRSPFNHACVMYRREAVLDAGGYQEFQGFEDYYLWVRMLKKGYEGWNLRETVMDVRIGDGMSARRGGISYLRTVVRFQRYLRREKVIGTGTFFLNCFVRCAGAVVPSGVREELYRVFLRKKS